MAELAAAQARTEEAEARTEARMAELAAAQARTEEAEARTEARMAELAAAQVRTDEAQARTEARMAELAAAQARTEEAQARTETRMAELAAAEARTEARVAELAAAEARTEARMAELAAAHVHLEQTVARLVDRVADLDGRVLEGDYERKAPSIFGRLLSRTAVVDRSGMADALARILSAAELADALDLDVVVSGTPRERPEIGEIWIATEVSSVVDRTDLERAARRAALLRKLGRPVVAAVAGRRLTEGVEASLKGAQVVSLVGGQVDGWADALQALDH
jgi:hypothetical protein